MSSGLRLGVSLDGVLADFDSAYRDLGLRLFGPLDAHVSPVSDRPPAPVGRGGRARKWIERLTPSQRARIWAEIEETQNFWETLAPTDLGAVQRLAGLALRYGWEIIFLARRRQTAGDSVQSQSQRWLARHGCHLPYVVVADESRKLNAEVPRLDVLVDDALDHCTSVMADSRATALLVHRGSGAGLKQRAGKLGVRMTTSIAECLDLLEDIGARSHEFIGTFKSPIRPVMSGMAEGIDVSGSIERVEEASENSEVDEPVPEPSE